jgi:hypothetical protein
MRYLKKYNNWILLEKRDIKSREKLTVANRIVDFLKKYSFEYVWRVYGRGRDFNKQPMTLLQYRGDLKKPIKVIDSSSGQDGF